MPIAGYLALSTKCSLQNVDCSLLSNKHIFLLIENFWIITSGQDGGIGKHCLPLCTTT